MVVAVAGADEDVGVAGSVNEVAGVVASLEDAAWSSVLVVGPDEETGRSMERKLVLA